MRNPVRWTVVTFAVAGSIVAAVTVLLFFQLSDASARSETFNFTVWFVVFQEAVLFGSFALNVASSGRTPTALPVRMGYITATLLYNCIAIATVIIFNFLLLPQHVRPTTYYTVAIAETALWLALLVILRLVDIAHFTAHRQAELMHGGVDAMVLTCDRIRATSETYGWRLAPAMRELAEHIRFSEGLRRSSSLAAELSARLNELEALISVREGDRPQDDAARLVGEISIMAKRRG